MKVLFSGRVQGVGFRYTTLRLARAMGVKGYVKNLEDGRVEGVFTGERAWELVKELCERFEVRKVEIELGVEDHGEFRIEY